MRGSLLSVRKSKLVQRVSAKILSLYSMPLYSVYGLTIHSEIPLPGMRTGEGPPDVLVRYGQVERQPPEEIRINGYYGLSGDDIHYVWRGICRTRIQGGREITVEPDPGDHEDAIMNLVIGPFIALAMHQRGRLVMHGSGVLINGAVVGFVGNSGQGKSTTAAAFMLEGYPIVTDDLLSVMEQDDDGGFIAHIGGSQIKLWPESVRAIGADPDHLPRIASVKDKRMYSFERSGTAETLPIACIYVLEEGEEGIEPLKPNEALVELARHSYCAILIDEMGDRRRHFMQCARLAARIPVRRLRRRLSLDRLDNIVRMVVEDQGGSQKSETKSQK